MTRLWLAVQQHAPPAGEAHGPAAGPFDINTGLIFWTLLVFGLLLALLWRFAWPTILRSVEERERRIQRQLDEAEANRAESARVLEEHRALIAGARAEAQELIAKAKSVGEKEREALLVRARHEQEELLARARKEIQDERQKAVLALRREAVDLALAAAAKLVNQTLDDETNRRLVTEYLATIDQAPR